MLSNFVSDQIKRMSKPDVLYFFQGVIDESITEKITELMEQHFNKNEIPSDRRKKFYLIMVECVQNVYHHQLRPEDNHGNFESGIMVSTDNTTNYRIVSGNHIVNSSIPHLTEKIEKMNAMTPEQLRAYYQEQLAVAELSEKGGAGLGILDMARKSKMPLEYEFVPINDKYSFFILGISIP
jgi:hypothetical protein